MENAIPSLVIGAILLLASSLMARSSIHTFDQLSDSVKDMQTRLSQQVTTRLSVTGVSVSPAGDTLDVSLRNDGQSRIAAFDRIDVIVTYYTSPATETTAWLPFSSGAGPNAWTLTSIDNDVYEPGILNPGETAHFEVGLSPAVQSGKTNLIVINSDSGSSATAAFTS